MGLYSAAKGYVRRQINYGRELKRIGFQDLEDAFHQQYDNSALGQRRAINTRLVIFMTLEKELRRES